MLAEQLRVLGDSLRKVEAKDHLQVRWERVFRRGACPQSLADYF